MARRNVSTFEVLVELVAFFPWWFGVALAPISYLLLHHYAQTPLPQAHAAADVGVMFNASLVRMVAGAFQYLLPTLFLLGAVLSAYKRWERRMLLATAAASGDVAALNEPSWHDFEKLVGEMFRRRGYRIAETGGGGPDGGIDLVVERDGRRYLVQCKQWRNVQVGVREVRELNGIVAAEQASGGIFVTSGSYTPDALGFGRKAGLELIDGETLVDMVRASGESSTPGWRSNRAGVVSAAIVPGVAITIGMVVLILDQFKPAPAVAVTRPAVPAPVQPPPVVHAVTAPPAPAVSEPVEPSPPAESESQRLARLRDEFDKQYVVPAGCDSYRSQRHMVECINLRMRAESEFLTSRGAIKPAEISDSPEAAH